MFEVVNGRLMNVVSFGTGDPPIVLVGGWIGPWQVWRQTMEELAREFRCVAYDHRGAGQTVTDPGDFKFDGMVDDVFALMDHLEIDRCWLGGESQGGTIACAAAIRDPSRFHGQFLIGTGPEILFGKPQQYFAEMLDSDQVDVAMRNFVDLVIPERNSDHYKRWLKCLLDEAEPGAGAELLRSLGGTSIEADLGKISIPTLVIHGEQDHVMPLDGARRLAEAIPGSHLHVMEGVGHVPTITRPIQTAKLIQNFIGTSS